MAVMEKTVPSTNHEKTTALVPVSTWKEPEQIQTKIINAIYLRDSNTD